MRNPSSCFVRDSKYTNIRVFDREALNLEATNNNKVFAKLSTGGDFIGSSNEPLGESYDMEVIGDSLYAFIPRTGTIYSWKVEDIIQQKDYAPLKVSRSQEFKLRSISKTGDKDKFFVSMLKDGKIQLAEYSLADFQARNFANPLRCFTADDRVLLPSQTIIAYQKEKLILTNGAKLDRWDIRNNPAYEIKPRQK